MDEFFLRLIVESGPDPDHDFDFVDLIVFVALEERVLLLFGSEVCFLEAVASRKAYVSAADGTFGEGFHASNLTAALLK